MYNIEDLKVAKENLEKIIERDCNYTGGNPNKYRTQLKEARNKVEMITNYLKNTGVIELTEKEKLENELNDNYPNAKNKEVVEYKGKKYRKRFTPREWSRSRKTIVSWMSFWEEL